MGDRLAGGNTAPLSHRDPLFDPLGHFYRDFAVWPTYLQRWYDEAWDTHQENMQLIQRLESIANQDALTGTANRRALNAYLAAIWQQKRRWR